MSLITITAKWGSFAQFFPTEGIQIKRCEINDIVFYRNLRNERVASVRLVKNEYLCVTFS